MTHVCICVMTHSYMPRLIHACHICVPWRIHVWGFILWLLDVYFPWLIRIYYDVFMCATYMCHDGYSSCDSCIHICHEWFICVMTYSYVLYNFAMTHSCADTSHTTHVCICAMTHFNYSTTYSCVSYICAMTHSHVVMGWLRLVGSLKSYVSFAEYGLFYRAFLPKRPMILSSLLNVATPYLSCDKNMHVYVYIHL